LGWIPVEIKLHGLVTEEQLRSLTAKLFAIDSNYKIEKLPINREVNGRFKKIDCDYEIRISAGNAEDKQSRYKELLTRMLSDQLDWIKDHNHIRIIDGNNAIESLRIAESASRMAQNL
jgi:hypothetical protein